MRGTSIAKLGRCRPPDQPGDAVVTYSNASWSAASGPPCPVTSLAESAILIGVKRETRYARYLILAAVIVIAGPIPTSAQSGDGDMRSSLAGVYTDAQAKSGSDVYSTMCTGCHTPESHTGTVFYSWWAGYPLADMYAYISLAMPQDNPGALSRGEYTQIIAYLLQLNGMPSGTTELPTDTALLRSIRFDTVPHSPRPDRISAPAYSPALDVGTAGAGRTFFRQPPKR